MKALSNTYHTSSCNRLLAVDAKTPAERQKSLWKYQKQSNPISIKEKRKFTKNVCQFWCWRHWNFQIWCVDINEMIFGNKILMHVLFVIPSNPIHVIRCHLYLKGNSILLFWISCPFLKRKSKFRNRRRRRHATET